jgi:hypothetical protein
MINIDKLEIINLVPKFLDFYEKANQEGVDAEERWKLWEEHYHFAAVPPGEEGKALARDLLDAAWNRYAESMESLRNWEPDPLAIKKYVSKVKQLLGCEESIPFVVVYFVGGFEGNPFVAPFDSERSALCLPVENGNSDILLAHELTHIVHAQIAGFSANWERTIAAVVLQEGLATRVSKHLVPGKSDEAYIEFTPDWLESCERKKEDIFNGIFPYLSDSSSEKVYQFTMGNGTTGIEREAYFVGWKVVGSLLENGVPFKEIARTTEENMPEFLRSTLHKALIM